MARRKPLDGVRVLDLTRLLPGPVCTLHLADLGADVIKIEDPEAGDYARGMDARPGEMSVFYRMVNRSKRSVCLDLKQAEDRGIFLALCREAHVLAEGFRPGVTARLGIDYAAVRAANPAIVYCSITGYGQAGPYAQRAGHDINYLSLAGVLDQAGTAGGPPALSNLQVADLLGGAQTAAIGILAALLDARSTGQGRHVDVAMCEATLAHNVFALHALQTHGRTLPRGTDLLTGGYPCYRVYATRDGRHVAVGALEEKFWRSFCDAMGRPDWIPLQFATGDAGAALGAEVAAAFARESQAHWVRVFGAIDCCVTPVLSLEEALADEHLCRRGVALTSADGLVQYAPPFRLSDDEFAVSRPAPRLGEHTQSVLREFGLARERPT
jgi:crotonobetainyl-CoA:carnitine CoA-transferase CaiB-like acyl-CoA transferase